MNASLPLRVALDATPLLGTRTGVGMFTAHLFEQLAHRDDIHPVAFAVTWRGRHVLSAELPAAVEVVDRPLPARPLRAAWGRAAHPRIETLIGAIDVVHGTNFVVPPASKAGTVVTVHDLTSLHFPDICTRDVRQYPRLLRAAIRRGAFVHAVSRFVAHEVVELLGAPVDRVATVHQGVPEVPAADPGEGHRLAGAIRYVLALGTAEPRKELPLLVQAFDRVAGDRDGTRLVIAGPEGWGEDPLRDAIETARHRSRIVRLGWVPDSARAALLRGATLLAYPSRYEGFGFPPLEAMSVGVPVVATATGSLPEVLGDAARLVPVQDAEALAEAMAGVLDDDGERERLVKAGQAQAERYSWKRCADGLAELYRRASGGV